MENASRNYSYSKVKKMIEHEQKKYGWADDINEDYNSRKSGN